VGLKFLSSPCSPGLISPEDILCGVNSAIDNFNTLCENVKLLEAARLLPPGEDRRLQLESLVKVILASAPKHALAGNVQVRRLRPACELAPARGGRLNGMRWPVLS
jgi:hypothetical protein